MSAAAASSWAVAWPERPMVENAHRRLHWRARARYDAGIREGFGWLAKAKGIPHLDAATITVEHRYTGPKPDVGACAPTAKAAIDGLVDAGVLDDDGPDHLFSVTYVTPVHGAVNELVLTITAAVSGAGETA